MIPLRPVKATDHYTQVMLDVDHYVRWIYIQHTLSFDTWFYSCLQMIGCHTNRRLDFCGLSDGTVSISDYNDLQR